jgi:hypothetical protein
MKTIYRTPPEGMEGGFTPVPNKEVVFNRNLSCTAKVLLITMLACKPDTVTTKRLMMGYTGFKQVKLDNALQELLDKGFAKQVPIKWTKELPCRFLYEFYDMPQSIDKSYTDDQYTDDRLLMSNCLFKKDSSKSISSEKDVVNQPSAELQTTPAGVCFSSAGAEELTPTHGTQQELDRSLRAYRTQRDRMLECTGHVYTQPQEGPERNTLAALCRKDLKGDPDKIKELILVLNTLNGYLQREGIELFRKQHMSSKLKYKRTINEAFPVEYKVIADLNFANDLRKMTSKLRQGYRDGLYGKRENHNHNPEDNIQMPPELL